MAVSVALDAPPDGSSLVMSGCSLWARRTHTAKGDRVLFQVRHTSR